MSVLKYFLAEIKKKIFVLPVPVNSYVYYLTGEGDVFLCHVGSCVRYDEQNTLLMRLFSWRDDDSVFSVWFSKSDVGKTVFLSDNKVIEAQNKILKQERKLNGSN